MHHHHHLDDYYSSTEQVLAVPVNCTGTPNNDYYSLLRRFKPAHELYLNLVNTHKIYPGVAWLLPTMVAAPQYLALLVVQYHDLHPIENIWVVDSMRSLISETVRLELNSVAIPSVDSRDTTWEETFPWVQRKIPKDSKCEFYFYSESLGQRKPLALDAASQKILLNSRITGSISNSSKRC